MSALMLAIASACLVALVTRSLKPAVITFTIMLVIGVAL